MKRTFAIGDIHGDAGALDEVMARMPKLTADDTIVFLGDYIDRGPDSRGVIERVAALPKQTQAAVVTLRGNHEDAWLRCLEDPDAAMAFLLPPGNGCGQMFRSVMGRPRLKEDDELGQEELSEMLDVRRWFPSPLADWLRELPHWYEDDHAIYVHAGLDGEGHEWKHPRDSRLKPLLWMREPDFYANYKGKRVVFGHTSVKDLPRDHESPEAREHGDAYDVWWRGDLCGIDTGCGKGGHLSVLELPSLRIYESR